MNLGATELFHSVTPTGSGYIYSRAKFWKFLRNPSPAQQLALPSWFPDRLLVTSSLLSLVSAAVNGFRPRRCRRSKSTAKLGYGLDLCAIHV